jgi:hypothetical protein
MLLTREQVLAAVSHDEAWTVTEVCIIIAKALDLSAWAIRGTVRNRLEALAGEGIIIADDGRPVRFMRPDPSLR